MNINKIEQDLLKELQSTPRNGARYRLPCGRVMIINPTGSVAFVLDAVETFHLSEKCFPYIDRVPISAPDLTEATLLKPTGMEKVSETSRIPSVIFDHPDGGKTYLSKKFLAYFDKGAKLYQEKSFKYVGRGVEYSVAAVVENGVIVGYILPVRTPKDEAATN